MGRKPKRGLDYFPLDTVFNDKVELLKVDHGGEGLAILIQLWQKIYANSYYITWNRDNSKLFSSRCGYDFKTVNDVVETCFGYNLFDRELWENYKVLTSPTIQKRYLEATARRKEIIIFSEYLLIDKPENVNENVTIKELNPECSNINKINVDINKENEYKSTQSKVKYSKVKESTKTSTSASAEKANEVYEYWQSKEETITHRSNQSHIKAIKARIKDGFTVEEMKKAIDRLCKLYSGEVDTWLETEWTCKQFFSTGEGQHVEKMLESFEHFSNGNKGNVSNNPAKVKNKDHWKEDTAPEDIKF